MAAPSAFGEQLEHAFSLDPSYREHDVGHAVYLLRYRTVSGSAFAVGRTTIKGANVWIPGDDSLKAALTADGFDCRERGCDGKSRGRIITLQPMPEFAGKPAISVHVKTVGEALAVASRMR